MVMEWGNMVQYEQPTINMKIEDFFFFLTILWRTL